MSQEKILSKVLIPATGETYTIGVRGSREQVALKLTADSLVNWHEHEVTIQNLSDGTSQIKQLSTNGECNFEIPLGNRYSISLPFIEGYIQPNALAYTATLSSRNIEYSYNNLKEYLTIRIVVRSEAEEHTAAIFNGLDVTCKGSNGKDYSGTIQEGKVTIMIPYGITYTIEMPQIAGLSHNHTNETFKAGIAARNLVYSYIDYHNLHITGLDKDGNVYTIADIQKMTAEEKTKIIAGAYNDQTLALAPRKDGGTGCGFAFLVDNPTVAGSWTKKTIDFGINNKIIGDAVETGVLDEGCGYYADHDKAFAIKDGSGESALVMKVGKILADAGELGQSNPTPIFQQAFNTTLTINDVERSGFIPSFGQFYALFIARDELNSFYDALNKTAPNFLIGYWWCSSQATGTSAGSLNAEQFKINNKKTDHYSALICFDRS